MLCKQAIPTAMQISHIVINSFPVLLLVVMPVEICKREAYLLGLMVLENRYRCRL